MTSQRRRIARIGWTARVGLVVTLLTLGGVGAIAAEGRPPPVDFANEILPLLRRACWECHGPQRQEGGLRLDQPESVFRGGDSGPAIVAGDAAASELIARVSLPRRAAGVMPARGEPLTAGQIELLRRWIDGGAAWPAGALETRHWAYVVPGEPSLPPVLDRRWPLHPIDYFILAGLERAGLAPSPPADAATLVRRLHLDLIGLPPAPDEAEQFLADSAPGAYERLVDRLLASPQFGVRWARPWLDYARYADSHGFQRDDFRELWAYRDWVVTAWNSDMPFDRFTIEQLAGDLLPTASEAQQIASGFNRNAPTNVEAGSDPEETRTNQVLDRVNTLGMVWLGTTLECCQCHDHKYDPFTMRDYYGLFAFFNQTEIEAQRSDPKVPGSIRFLGPAMTLGRELQEQARREPGIPPDTARPLRKEQSPPPATTLVMRELSQPRATALLLRGDFRNPGPLVEPATPSALHPLDPAPATLRGSAGARMYNRTDLAWWLLDGGNPLTARVVVNRWWGELFGHGLVLTPEDFGTRGEPPTHPELLDWLAIRYRREGWSLKRLLRDIVCSATYRQSSRATPALLARDDRNLLYARGPRFRLDAESIRDNALGIAGLLSLNQGGPPIRPYQPEGVWVKVGGERYEYVVSPGESRYRRGLYVIWKRGAPYPSFVNFDASNRMACRVQRPKSNTPLQALTLMNDPVYVDAAKAFARRVLDETPGASSASRIEHAFRLALVRRPQPGEADALRRLFEDQLAASRAASEATVQFIGSFDVPPAVTPAEFVAWYAVATAILNLDETITKG